jgi:tRNA(Phe) wybutosine-synthesizing methylase Tyw3
MKMNQTGIGKKQTEDPKLFDRQKLSVIGGSDLSRKGDVDKDIRNLLGKMNAHKNFFSLSSCSGRIIILRQQTQTKVKNQLVSAFANNQKVTIHNHMFSFSS